MKMESMLQLPFQALISGNIQLLDPDTHDLKIISHRSALVGGWISDTGKEKEPAGSALERGEHVIVEDVEQSPNF